MRAKPLEKPTRHGSVDRQTELELISRYHATGDPEALEKLVEAHRPMIVSMARPLWRGNGTSLKALVEYGMVGLRIAADPPRPSKTKKGEMVGFNVNAGYRFSTYARPYALKEMRWALSDDPGPSLKSKDFPKAALEAESWHVARSLRGLIGAPAVVPLLVERRQGYRKSYRPWTLWNPPAWAKNQYKRKVLPRKTRRTETELANRDAYHLRHWPSLKSYEAAVKDVMEGWRDDEEADSAFLVASFERSHALDGKNYRLPTEVLRYRHKKGCRRLEKKIPFSANDGLGLFDKFGRLLPIYHERVVIRVRKKPGVILNWPPLASIYLVRGRNIEDIVREQPDFDWNDKVVSFRRLRIISGYGSQYPSMMGRFRLSCLRTLFRNKKPRLILMEGSKPPQCIEFERGLDGAFRFHGQAEATDKPGAIGVVWTHPPWSRITFGAFCAIVRGN